ncbi:MAG: SHOCT domain-containing protein [Alphaproteobacteria bacterium]
MTTPMRALAMCLLLAGCVTAGQKSEIGSSGTSPLVVGMKVQGTFSIGAVSIPLPPGDWVVAFLVDRNLPVSPGGTNYVHVGLVEQLGGKLQRGLIVNTVAAKQSSGYGWNRFLDVCDRKDGIFNGSPSYVHSEAGRCWILDYTMSPAAQQGMTSQDPVMRGLYGYMAANRIDSQVPLVYARFYLTNRVNYAHVTYFFNPEAVGIGTRHAPKESSDWHPTRYANAPDRRAFVEMLKGFSAEMEPLIAAGLDNRLPLGVPSETRSLAWQPVTPTPQAPAASTPASPPQPPPAAVPAQRQAPAPAAQPAPAPASGGNPSVEQRLQVIRDLRSRGVITNEEYERRRKAIVDTL